MARILVLGAGRIPRAIVHDLVNDHDVCLADLNPEALKTFAATCQTLVLDVTNEAALADSIGPYDLVIGCVPGFLGYQTAHTVISSGKAFVDIAFFPEDPRPLHALALSSGSVAVLDAGIAPGFSNLFLGDQLLQGTVDRFRCLVGGLPVHPKPPLYYATGFSPIDVLEEYTRPARIRRHNKEEVCPPLSEVEDVTFRDHQLQAFLSDGLRSLLWNCASVPNMEEKTLRNAAHTTFMRSLQAAGFFEMHGNAPSNLELTSRLMLPLLSMEEGEADVTLMRLEIEREGRLTRLDISDRMSHETGLTSMARCTGFTCTAIARAILAGDIADAGAWLPEQLPAMAPHIYATVAEALAQRGIEFHYAMS